MIRLDRMRSRLEEGKTSLVSKEADDVFTVGKLSAAEWQELAAVYVKLSAAVQKEPAQAHAVAALGKAIQSGHVFATPLADDPRFRALAAREDFKSLPPARQK
jgi:hypothetical protein